MGGPNGDLYIRVLVGEHLHFTRQGLDIHLIMPISFLEIMNESTIDVPTPDGVTSIKLKSNYTSDTILKISNKGFVSVRNTQIKGDLKVHLNVYIPKMSSKETKKINEIIKNKEDKKRNKWFKEFE